LEDCYFTLADRFTAKIEVADYTNFLNRLLGRMVNVSQDGVVTFKSTEDIFELGDKDPLLDENSVFQFESAEERESKSQRDRRKSIADVASKLGRGSTRGSFRTQRSRSMSEVTSGVEGNKSKNPPPLASGQPRTITVNSYHDEHIDFEPQDRDVQRWKKLFELAGCSADGSGPDSRDHAIAALRAHHSAPVADLFKDGMPDDPDEDLEMFLEKEFELPGHAHKRQSLRADDDDDIFAELFQHLPFQAFRDFGELIIRNNNNNNSNNNNNNTDICDDKT
jgi:hypothetical protein